MIELRKWENLMTPRSELRVSLTRVDLAKEVREFDDTKIGVKGLVDSSITTIPRFFVHPPATTTTKLTSESIPVIDLSIFRSIIVDQIRHASHTWGFVQIINHGIPPDFLEHLMSSVKAINEQPPETKSLHYNWEVGHGVSFSTNFNLLQSKAGSWRDTMQIRLGSTLPNIDRVPEMCRNEVVEWDQHIQQLADTLTGFLSEGLGLETERLKELTFLEGRLMVAHYCPYCPQPDWTVGINSHTDPGLLTLLLQDQVEGLQVKHGEDWVDVKPIGGALVINIADILQMVSNDEYKSLEHRVLANPFREPRVLVGVFFNLSNRECLYGPLPGLLSQDKPALYQQFTLTQSCKNYKT